MQSLRKRASVAVAATETSRWFRFARDEDNAVYLSWPGVLLAALASDRRRIQVASATPAGPASLQSYLFAQILSFPLLHLGIDPLHGTVLTSPAGTFGLLGDSGVGKSTLAGALLSAGARMVSDDLLAVRDSLTVLTGPSRLRLQPATARRLLPADTPSTRMNSHTRKRAYDLPGSRPIDPAPLRALYVLEAGEASGPALQIARVSSADALRLLLHHTFNPLETTASRLRRQLESYGRIVKSVPVRRIRVRRQFRHLAAAAHGLLEDVAGVTAPDP